jgi:hypothetical protein
MWLYTTKGFFSVVKDLHSDDLLVRARFKGDIENLLKNIPLFTSKIDGIEVLETNDADYRFRAVVPHWLLGDIVADMIVNTGYTNFKSACFPPVAATAAPPDVEMDPIDVAREDAYHAVWGVMARAQREAADDDDSCAWCGKWMKYAGDLFCSDDCATKYDAQDTNKENWND